MKGFWNVWPQSRIWGALVWEPHSWCSNPSMWFECPQDQCADIGALLKQLHGSLRALGIMPQNWESKAENGSKEPPEWVLSSHFPHYLHQGSQASFFYYYYILSVMLLQLFWSLPLCRPPPSALYSLRTISPPLCLSMGLMYKFFGYFISYTILYIPMAIL